MAVVNVHEAKTTLSALLARAQAGEEIIIVRNGKPVARLVARLVALPGQARRQPGSWRADPAWAAYRFDPGQFAPMADAELQDAGWLPG